MCEMMSSSSDDHKHTGLPCRRSQCLLTRSGTDGATRGFSANHRALKRPLLKGTGGINGCRSAHLRCKPIATLALKMRQALAQKIAAPVQTPIRRVNLYKAGARPDADANYLHTCRRFRLPAAAGNLFMPHTRSNVRSTSWRNTLGASWGWLSLGCR